MSDEAKVIMSLIFSTVFILVVCLMYCAGRNRVMAELGCVQGMHDGRTVIMCKELLVC